MVPAVVPEASHAPPVPPVAKAGRRVWLWVAGAVVAAGLGGLLYLQPWVPTATPVAVEVVAVGPVTRVLAVNGRVEGVQSVDVRPQVSGTLTEVLVAEGDVVAAGAAVARIDPATQQAAERAALAALDAALVAEAEAQAVYARTQALGTNAARVVLDSAARAVQSAGQEVARMTALLDQAQIQLAKFTIRAPLAGTVLVMTAEPGQSVDPATVLMTITDLTQLVVETDVDESYATQIRVGQPAALQLAGETEVRAAYVSFVSQRVNETTGGLAVELSAEAALVAPVGLTVTANITVDDRAEAITVPRAALQDGGVLVVADGVAAWRAVEVIDWPAARLIVTGGLAVGDVVIADATGITDGQAVEMVP
jgi:RND family efflux transporter MFP subunit